MSSIHCVPMALASALIVLVGMGANRVGAGEPTHSTSAQSSASIEVEGNVVTVHRTNRMFELAGPDIEGRNANDRLLLRKEIETTEVIGDKGMDGRVNVWAWTLGVDVNVTAPLYVISASGLEGRVTDNDVYVIERGLDEIEWQSVFSLADGDKLFDATVPWLLATNGGAWNERHYLALAQVFEDADDAALRRDDAIALLTYASRTRVLNQVLIRADKADRARLLRSVWDQTIKFSWSGKSEETPSPDGPVPDLKAEPLTIAIRFSPDGATLQIPVGERRFDLSKATTSTGLSLERFPPDLLIGRWMVTDAKPAPWLTAGTDISATITLFENKTVDVKADRVVSESPISCGNARYDTALVPPHGLFQGGFEGQDAIKSARRLGLSADETRSVSLTCDTGVYEFHLPEPNRALTAFDNVIFSLNREP